MNNKGIEQATQWSAPVLFACNNVGLSCIKAHIILSRYIFESTIFKEHKMKGQHFGRFIDEVLKALSTLFQSCPVVLLRG